MNTPIRNLLTILLLTPALLLIFCEEQDPDTATLLLHVLLDKTLGALLILLAARLPRPKSKKTSATPPSFKQKSAPRTLNTVLRP